MHPELLDLSNLECLEEDLECGSKNVSSTEETEYNYISDSEEYDPIQEADVNCYLEMRAMERSYHNFNF